MSILGEKRLQVTRNKTKAEVELDQEAVAQAGWGVPMAFGRFTPPPAFPVDILPRWWQDFVVETAEALQVPVDAPAMLSLAAIAGGFGGRIRYRIREGWSKNANLYIVVAMSPGERKSAVFRAVNAPIFAAEKNARELARPRIAAAMSDKAVLEARYKTLLAKAAKATEPTEGEQAKTEARELAVEIEQFVVPVEPRFIVDDETGASLGKTLIEQGGRLFQAGAEGTAFANALGRFSDDEDFDVYLKSHDGDSLRIGRVGRGYSAHDNPCLTCGLAVQPAVIHSLGKSELAAGLGFLARWLYAFPEGRVGTRKTRPTPCRSITSQNYASIVSSIWLLPSDNEPMELWFSPEADDILAAFEDRLEPRLRAADGDLGNLEAWGTKLAGEVARIAGNIHMGTATGLGKLNDPGRVSATAVASAIRLAEEYLIPHAIRAFGAMHTDPRESLAVRVIDWLARRPDAELFTRNEAYQGLKGGRSNLKAEDLSPAFELLTSHGYLRVEAPPKSFGRQPERYGVNPHWNRSDFRDRSPESPESRNGEAEGKLSGDSGDHFRNDAHFETEAIV